MAKSGKTRSATTAPVKVEEDNTPDLGNEKQATATPTATQMSGVLTGEPGEGHAVPGNDPSTKEYKTVRPTGSFSLQDPWTNKNIQRGEETKVVVTQFIRDRLENGDLEEV